MGGAWDWIVDVAAPGLYEGLSDMGGLALKAWDSFSDSPALIGGAVAAAGGIADYYNSQDLMESNEKQAALNRESSLYATKAREAQLAAHNKGIEDLSEKYKKKYKVLQGGA